MKQILFLAAIWGILEASVGWLLHIVHFPAGAVMFPIGLVILLAGYTTRPQRSTLLLIGLITAVIKLTNLVMPGREFVINPTLSILIESLLVAFIAPYIKVDWAGFRANFLIRETTLAQSLGLLGVAIGMQMIL